MKITKITLSSFRAFEAPFELDLCNGKNLLLHGENGSGKSSIYFALKRFFEARGDDINSHRNQFADPTKSPSLKVHFIGIDANGATFDRDVLWDTNYVHPLCIPSPPMQSSVNQYQRATLVDGAHRSGFIDYRAMLRTHYLAAPLSRSSQDTSVHQTIYDSTRDGIESQLFDFVTRNILAGTSVTISGGTTARIGELIGRVWSNPPATWHRRNLESANNHANAFNAGFNAKLLELEARLNEFLSFFDNHALQISFSQVSLSWDKTDRVLKGAELCPEVVYRGRIINNYHEILNEARLSAVAISLFLAGVSLSDNDFANEVHPRFLVLDDALIGLEVQNRLPVLKLLTSSYFQKYQIFLLTHDRVWYDLARSHLQAENGWIYREMIADESNGRLMPRIRPGKDDLACALEHLNNGDFRAAAVYARAAFETRLQNVCQDRGIPIKYKKDRKDISADMLWSGILARQAERDAKKQQNSSIQDFIPSTLQQDVERIRSNVLNQLSHTSPPNLGSAEVKDAIDTIKKLWQHPFP